MDLATSAIPLAALIVSLGTGVFAVLGQHRKAEVDWVTALDARTRDAEARLKACEEGRAAIALRVNTLEDAVQTMKVRMFTLEDELLRAKAENVLIKRLLAINNPPGIDGG